MMHTPLMKWIGLTFIGLALNLTASVATTGVAAIVSAKSPMEPKPCLSI